MFSRAVLVKTPIDKKEQSNDASQYDFKTSQVSCWAEPDENASVRPQLGGAFASNLGRTFVRAHRIRVKPRVLKGGKMGSGRLAGRLPPRLPTWPYIRLVLRVSNTGATDATTGLITVDDMLGACGVIGRVTNTSVTCIFSSFRVRKVTLYLAPATNRASAQVDFFSGTEKRNPDMEYDTSIPTNYEGAPATLVFTPPKASLDGFWYRDDNTGTDPVMSVICTTTGSVMDVELDATIDTAILSSNSIAVSTAVVGTFYRVCLNKTNVGAGGSWNHTNFATTI